MLMKRGKRLVRELQLEGRVGDAETVDALLAQLEGEPRTATSAAPRIEVPWLTTGEVAKRVGVSRQTVVNWVQRGILPGTRMGGRTLIAPAALADFVQLERILDDLDAERPALAPHEAAASVAQTRRGWTWQDPKE
jgi:excisionase family DNA binding protein